jgi:hypothetical protein
MGITIKKFIVKESRKSKKKLDVDFIPDFSVEH